jgi:hypothetical protein
MGAFSGPETADSGIVLALDAQNPLSVGNTSLNVWEDVLSSTTTVSSVGVITCLSVDIASNQFFGIKHSSCLISGSAVWDNRPPSVSDMNEILSGNLTCKSYQTGTYDQVQYYFGAFGNAGNVCTLRFTGFGVGAVIGVGGYFNAVSRQCRLTGDLQNSPVTITSPSGGFADPIVLTSDPADIQFSNPGSSGDPMYVYWLGPYNQVPYNTLRSSYGTLTNGPVFTQEPKLEPFGGAGAVSFDGNSDSLTVPASTDFTLDGEFTAEFWIYLNTIVLDSQNPSPITFSQSGGNKGQIYVNASNNYFSLWDGSSNVVTTGNNSITTGSWYHVAATRDSSNNCRIFLDGVLKDTASSTHTFGNASGDLRIGSFNGTGGDVNGYISNLRVVKGTALYTSNFTPKRQPLLPESAPNTVLLTCQKGTIRDRSPSAHDITINGNAKSISGASYFYFDGVNDYATIPDSDSFTFGSENFAIECWIYPNSTGSFPSFISKYAGSSTNSSFFFSLGNSNQTLEFYLYNGVSAQQAIIQAGTVSLSSWNHVVATRIGNQITTYLNGSVAGTQSWSYSVYDANVAVTVGAGQYNGGYYWNGNISNVRIYKGKGLTASEVLQNYQNAKSRYGL